MSILYHYLLSVHHLGGDQTYLYQYHILKHLYLYVLVLHLLLLIFDLNGRVPDEGGCVELGMAYAWGIKSIGFKTDTRALDYTGDDNLMIEGCLNFKIARNFIKIFLVVNIITIYDNKIDFIRAYLVCLGSLLIFMFIKYFNGFTFLSALLNIFSGISRDRFDYGLFK